MISVDRALDALGDPTRRRVFAKLRHGSRSVRDIAHDLEVTRPAVSQHLKVLKGAGLVVFAPKARDASTQSTRPVSMRCEAGSTDSGMKRWLHSRARLRTRQPNARKFVE